MTNRRSEDPTTIVLCGECEAEVHRDLCECGRCAKEGRPQAPKVGRALVGFVATDLALADLARRASRAQVVCHECDGEVKRNDDGSLTCVACGAFAFDEDWP